MWIDDWADHFVDCLTSHRPKPAPEARAILYEARGGGGEPKAKVLGNLFAELFGPDNGVDLEAYLQEREAMRDPPGLGNDRS